MGKAVVSKNRKVRNGPGIKTYIWKHKYLYLMLVPAIVYYIIFCYVPMYGVTIAFKDFNPMKGIMRSSWVGFETFQKLFEKQVIEVAPLAYMRGRTLDDAFIILDEAQNTTPEQMKMFLTRMGVGSKVVVTGDVTQIDLPDKVRSGLIDALHVLQDVEGIAQVRLTEKDVVRHRLVQQIVKAYEKAAEEKTRGEANHK